MRMVILCSWKSITVGVMLSQDPLCQFRDHGLNYDLEAPKGMDVYPLFFFATGILNLQFLHDLMWH